MILDTNAYSAALRGNEQVADLIRQAPIVSLTLPTLAELHAGFIGGNQLERNQEKLSQFLSQPLVQILLPDLATTQHYANLQLHCRRRGRNLSNNDVWIAALTQQFDETLVTYDQDFAVFQELLGDQLIILG